MSEPLFVQDGVTLYHGDCMNVLAEMPDESVHAVVTDPPYGLSFMGKRWDYDVPGVEVWQQCLRVLKPGGHLLAFAGTRTQHRMAVRIEDAGFEIRDMIAWVYGSGFPKSLNVAKAIESGGGRPEDIRRMQLGEDYKPSGRGRINYDHGAGSAMGAGLAEWQPATEDAKRWQGWGTALKPALEPITVARKPLCGTVAENVLTHGCGGLNVDGCRVPTDDLESLRKNWDRRQSTEQGIASTGLKAIDLRGRAPSGRWPANLIHDGSDEVTGLFPEAGGGFGKRGGRDDAIVGEYGHKATMELVGHGDSGSAARFFYCAKASKAERGEGNKHPTVKPIKLMRYLVRLVCPPGGTVLDPFAGSGTTLMAGKLENCCAIGIERELEYCEFVRDVRFNVKGEQR